MKGSVRVRAGIRVSILCTPVLIAACLGGRGPQRPPVAAPPKVTPAESVPPVAVVKPPDSVVLSDSARDSLFRVADSLKKVAADSAKAAAAKPAAKPPAKKAKECLLNMDESPPTARFTFQRQSDSSSNLMVGGGFVGRCTGEKQVLKADSAEFFEMNGYVNLFGNVTYEEQGEFRVTSNHATYFTREGKLYADGNVNAVQFKSGSMFTGPNIEYYRVMPDIRTTSRLYAPNNPLVTIFQKDSTGKDLPPVKVGASVMQDNGDSLLFAWGSVSVLRSEIQGKSDSASFDKPTGQARLIRAASIQSISKDQPFTLAGDTIDMFTTDSVLDRVLAKHRGRAKSGDVNISAERLDMRLVDRKIHRAYAFGTGRVKADTKEASLEADSMDILLPNQLIRELRAHGTAVAIMKPDSLKIKSDENDVLRGDTVIAEFDSIKVAGDTAAKAEIRRIVAGGNASSKVQIASTQGPAFPPSINYIRGKHLVVTFDSGQVRDIAVDSSASGSYFEPVVDSTADTTARNKPRRPPTPSARDAEVSDNHPLPSRPRPVNSRRGTTAALLSTKIHRTR